MNNDPLRNYRAPLTEEAVAAGQAIADDIKNRALSGVASHAVGCGDGTKPAPVKPINEGVHYGGPAEHRRELANAAAIADRMLPLKGPLHRTEYSPFHVEGEND